MTAIPGAQDNQAGDPPRDRLLVDQIANGDEAAFAAFYRTYERRLFGFIHKKMNDPHEAADILHITFMEVWRNAGTFEGRSRVSTWLFGIAYRKIVDRLRKNVPQPMDLEAEMSTLPANEPSAFDRVSQREQADHLHHCLDQLKPKQRTVVDLAFFEHMTYGEIAEVMDCPEGTVKTRIMHAKASLQTCIAKLTGRR